MSEKKNISFKKTAQPTVKNEKKINYLQKRKKIMKKISEDFNISIDEANEILLKIENNKTKNQMSKITPKQNQIKEMKKNSLNPKFNENRFKQQLQKQNNIDKHSPQHELNKKNKDPIQLPEQQKSNKNVDSIIADLIPNYSNECSIEVKNVNLTFEIEHDKIDTLKEMFIRTIKRDKSKKIKFQVLKDITFKIYKGEKVGIIGYNGAGKSTLLKVITGIYPPDDGEVTTNGNISPLLSLGAGFDPNYSGRKNIFLNGAVLGYDKKYLESKIDQIIEFSELEEFIDFPIKNYSSGMLAKLGFSIATAVNPDILIIDEILGVGDVTFQKKSADKIRSLINGGTTVLLVSHSIPQIRELCDKAIWIDKGKIKEIGEVNKVCDNYLKDSEKASNEQLKNIQFK